MAAMPGNLAIASVSPASTVFPLSLSASYTEVQHFPVLVVQYHDGTIEDSLIEDGVNSPRPERSWRLSKRLTPADHATLLAFWENTVFGGLKPFYFYDPFDPAPGQPIGSNYDPNGISTQGRVTVRFVGNWSQSAGLTLVDIPDLMLVETL